MKRMRRVLLVCLASLWGLANAQSPVFLRAYELALLNDPAYRAALKEFEASQQNREIGNAALRPVITFTQSNSKNKAARTLQDTAGRLQHDNPESNSASGSLALRQPLLSYEATARQRIGEVQALYGQTVLANKRQDLLVRLIKAWTELHFAQDQVRLAKSQIDALSEQLKLNEASLKLGEGTKTDVLETRTKYEITQGQLLEANLEFTNKQRALEAIIGTTAVETAPERAKMSFKEGGVRPANRGKYWVDMKLAADSDSLSIAHVPARVEIDRLPDESLKESRWMELALSNNPEIQSIQHLLRIAELEVDKATAGHLPKLELVMSRSHNRSDTLNTLNQQVQTSSLGVQLTVPLYAGGQVSATVTQSLATAEQQRAELDRKTEEIKTEVRKQLNIVVLNRQKKMALARAVEAAEDLVVAARHSIKAGVKVNLDVLNAVQQVYTLKRDLALTSYNLMNAWIGLRAAAGQINDETARQAALAIVH